MPVPSVASPSMPSISADDRPAAVAFREGELLHGGAAQAAAGRQAARSPRSDWSCRRRSRRSAPPARRARARSARRDSCGKFVRVRRRIAAAVMRSIYSSWPGLSRPSTTYLSSPKTWMPGTRPGMTTTSTRRKLHPHRHQHVERALGVLVLDQRRRAGVGELEHRDLAFDLRGDVEQIARVEADIERIGVVVDLELLGGAAANPDWSPTASSRPPVIESLTARPRSLDDGRDAVDRGLEILLVDGQRLVVVGRDDAPVIGEGAVDQLRGQHHVADGEADLAGRQFDRRPRLRRSRSAAALRRPSCAAR